MSHPFPPAIDAYASSPTEGAHGLSSSLSAVAQAPVILVGLNEQGEIALFNPEAERLSGLTAGSALGMRLDEALQFASGGQELIRRVAEAGDGSNSGAEVETVMVSANGACRSVHWRLGGGPGAGEGPFSIVAVGHDRTEENDCRDQETIAAKLAAMGTLAAGFAHELRNPLNGASLHLAYLRRALTGDPSQQPLLDIVGTAESEVWRAARLVTEFLDFARPKPLEKREIPLDTFLGLVIESCEPAVRALGSAITVDSAPSEVVLLADVDRMLLALRNLASNAAEALAARGGGAITLRAAVRDQQLCIVVEDDGPGLAAPSSRVFEPFFSTKPRGTGMGLAVCHRIMQDHGGTIGVESRPGRTQFRLCLPIVLPP